MTKNKIQTSVTLAPATMDFLKKKMEQSVFRSISHGIDALAADAQRRELRGE